MSLFTRNSPYYHLLNIYYSFWNTLYIIRIYYCLKSINCSVRQGSLNNHYFYIYIYKCLYPIMATNDTRKRYPQNNNTLLTLLCAHVQGLFASNEDESQNSVHLIVNYCNMQTLATKRKLWPFEVKQKCSAKFAEEIQHWNKLIHSDIWATPCLTQIDMQIRIQIYTIALRIINKALKSIQAPKTHQN
jgi:hypothetical protein